MTTKRVFVSHSHIDNAYCQRFVAALSSHGIEVWYDKNSLKFGEVTLEIERQLRLHPIFVPILSPAALASPWVKRESAWACDLQQEDHNRLILPVLTDAIPESDIWLFLRGLIRIQMPDGRPVSPEWAASEVAQRLKTVRSESTYVQPIIDPIFAASEPMTLWNRQDRSRPSASEFDREPNPKS